MNFRSIAFAAALILSVFASQQNGRAAVTPCEIQVVDKENGWPVPLVKLRTVNNTEFVTDNAGIVAFDLPELMNREVWLDVRGDGYGVPTDGFGNSGVRLKMMPGGNQRIEVTRSMIARRLGRLTGSGIFGEVQKLGGEKDWRETGVLGCDSVQNAVYRGRLHWVWGDTALPNYPLGIFDGTSAVTATNPLSSFEPPARLRLDYFTDVKGAPRGIAKMPGPGPTWLTGLVSLPDASGREHLVATYSKIRGHLQPYQFGLCVWNDATESFEPFKVIWDKASGGKRPLVLDGHAVKWTDSAGKKWILFCNPFPLARCPATFESWGDTNSWEALKPQRTLTSADEHEKIEVHSGAIAWNPWRRRWVTVFVQNHGKPSILGEVWYAEADTPTGPWGPAVKILSHENYTFYNPALHPEFVPDKSPVLLFEGTYSAEFANHPQPTPKYNYNQILYRLDLDDPRLLPARGK
ncbi:MAG TPA: hypothetical protein VFB72_11780 [Verrucomicrobiae bacterium]|nr:hypothetical protein [Verrucomicrobiae bacterium]